MPGVRLDRLFFASSAIVLLLSAAAAAGAGGALAGPLSETGTDVAQAASNATIVIAPDDGSAPATAAPAATDNATATPAPAATATPDESTAAPAATATPDESTAAPATVATPEAPPASIPDESNGQPTGPSPAAPATPATPATPAATAAPMAPAEQPAAATGTESNPAPAAVATPAPAPAAAPAAAAAAVDADAAIAEQLRELANGKFDRILGGKRERVTVDAFYSGRNYAPLWITDGKANARAIAAIAYLGQVAAEALDPADYPVPDFAALHDAAALAEAEIRLSASVITYAHHAEIGRVHWSRVSGDIYYDRKAPDPADVLAKMAEAKDIGAALDGYEPHDPAYLALKQKLAEIRAGNADAVKAPIAKGPALKVGMADARVPQLRERLGVADAGGSGGGGTTYDKTLAEAVKKFQREHDLRANGTFTAATVEALNGRAPEHPADIIIANMERWRWMPHDLGNTYVMVNLPDFTLRVMHDGREAWKTKIVDGKPAMPTPIMSAEMKFITVNPTWNVPPSIVAKEYMPALQQDPTVLERMGLTVSRNPDGTVHISQPPGDRNALGRVRFNFPNKFLVYQHDTPEKYLFAYDKRAFSHGCMRVQDPVKYAEVLLALVRPGDGYTQERIRKMFGNSEVDISFPKFIPVHLTYQTAFVDDAGNLEFRDDVYGRDKALLAILNGEERKVADIPIERKENTVRRELLAMPEPSFFGGRSLFGGTGFGSGSADGGGFFARLFGASPPPPPPPVVRHRTAAHRKTAQRRTELR